MNVKRFKNNNFNVRFDKDYRACLETGNCFARLLWDLDAENTDFYMVGDEWCAGNFDMGITLYNAYTGLCYNVLYNVISDAITNGKTIKLYGHKPDAGELDLIDS